MKMKNPSENYFFFLRGFRYAQKEKTANSTSWGRTRVTNGSWAE